MRLSQQKLGYLVQTGLLHRRISIVQDTKDTLVIKTIYTDDDDYIIYNNIETIHRDLHTMTKHCYPMSRNNKNQAVLMYKDIQKHMSLFKVEKLMDSIKEDMNNTTNKNVLFIYNKALTILRQQEHRLIRKQQRKH